MLRYLVYLFTHKWYVFLACCRLGIPWRGVKHDYTKFLPDEFFAYYRHFFADHTQAMPTAAAKLEFNCACVRHQRRNDHHWQYWLVPAVSSDVQVVEMSLGATKEMLADWLGAGRACKQPDTRKWYIDNRYKIVIGPTTRAWIEAQLHVSTPLF